jgi:hypothetical protein
VTSLSPSRMFRKIVQTLRCFGAVDSTLRLRGSRSRPGNGRTRASPPTCIRPDGLVLTRTPLNLTTT